MNSLNLAKLLAIVALVLAALSFFVHGPLVAIAVILLAIAFLV